MMDRENIKKVLILGSGALQIGQAGEFDYSGAQAIKAMKEEGVETVLINPNIATVQTSKDFADRIYFLPVTPYFAEKVIAKEKPDGILLAFGGQTALNCGVELHRKGILKKHEVAVLGTPVDAIMKTEDRELFNRELRSIDIKVPHSVPARDTATALKAGTKIGYPVIIRAAYSLGGKGSGIAGNREELREMTEKAFKHVPQILVEEYLEGWKEIEYEVVRDSKNNCVTVCNMENFDPMGIHTGESIVVAPSQTLTNEEYHSLRELSLKIIRHLGIVGECNVQFALSPDSTDYRVIEVNARLSRSSALASKATGYPLAFIAAKLAVGYSLHELENSVTKSTKTCFEPALDYVVVKIPRWDLQKFRRVSEKIGSEMKSVGEVMAIGRTFEETLQKAVRMLDIGMYGLVGNRIYFEKLSHVLRYPTDKRIFAIIDSLKKGTSVDKIHSLTRIDKWFLYKLKNVTDAEKEIALHTLDKMPQKLFSGAKKLGFSDKQIAMILGIGDESKVREARHRLGILPFVKKIDTLAAEYPAKANYLYLTYNAQESDIKRAEEKSVVVLGSGAYRIGSSVEFDWCCVTSALELRKAGYRTIMINYNPETVSTDYDICDRLYFDELSFESVYEIHRNENPEGLVVCMGGQIPNNLAMKCAAAGMKILGTGAGDIDKAENRHKFSKLCDSLGISQPRWSELKNLGEAVSFAKKVGYPVLIRPSYVLSGSAMNLAFNERDLKSYLKKATDVSEDYPVVISKFVLDAKEVEIDAVANNGEIVVWAFTEHVENAGTHSGDATMVLPPQKIYIETTRRMKETAGKIAKGLNITGPFNIQFLAKDNDIMVIECNLRASRSFPFVSKITGINFIEVAAKAITGRPCPAEKHSALDLDHVGVKAAQFSFSRLKGADPLSGVEMASTGEVACIGSDMNDALLKSLISIGHRVPEKTIIVSISGDENRYKFMDEMKALTGAGYTLYCTDHTHSFYRKAGISSRLIHKMHERKKPNITDYLRKGKIELVISIPNPLKQIDLDKNYDLRRASIDYNVSLITNPQLAKAFIKAVLEKKQDDLEIKRWRDYVA
jgi:carbamoyl-phosphate synthase large subunit